MSVSYDLFTYEFLAKISEYEFLQLPAADRYEIIDGYMKKAVAAFKNNCVYDLATNANDEERKYEVEVIDEDVDELTDIISEGMVVQWLKQYVYQQELLQNSINTRDYSSYSPAELLKRVGDAYMKAQKDFVQMIREYSYNHADLSSLHI